MKKILLVLFFLFLVATAHAEIDFGRSVTQSSADTLYVNISGDTMTGSLTMAANAKIRLTGTGTIETTSNGKLVLLPNGTGITQVGDAGVQGNLSTPTNDDLFVSGRLEVDGIGYFDNAVYFTNSLTDFLSGLRVGVNQSVSTATGSPGRYGYFVPCNGYQTPAAPALLTGVYANSLIMSEQGDYQYNFAHPLMEHPTLFLQSKNQSATEFAELAWNKTAIAAGSGSFFSILSTSEAITIPVGSGLDPVVLSTLNLAPANSMIMSVAFRVIDAPGGGATVIDIGRTNGGNLDEFIDGASCDVLGETGNNYANNDGVQISPPFNASADTLTLTTDADVTGDNMIIRVVVYYYQITVPTS